MKKTSLSDLHVKIGAKMVDFAGYYMPVSYSGIQDEHHAVRKSVGVFDVSHMGEFMVEGDNALELIQSVTTNDVSKLENYQAQYSCMTNENGGIVDDLLVYKFNDKKYMLVVNASNIEKDWNWISQHNNQSVTLSNVSDDMALLAVQGPKAESILQKLTDTNLSEIKYYHFTVGTLAGVENMIISATGYTGAGGFELYFPAEKAEHVWNAIFSESSEEVDVKPAGLGCRDTLRLEMGFCLYGNDINDDTNPLEAGLGWITKLNKGEFTASEKLKAIKSSGLERKLVGFKMIEKGIPRKDYQVVDMNGITIGQVTSGTQSPTLQEGIGMAYVQNNYSAPESEIYIQIRDNKVKAKVCPIPFIKK